MAKGVMGGLVAGVLVSGLGLGTASLLAPAPMPKGAVPAIAPLPEGSAFDAPNSPAPQEPPAAVAKPAGEPQPSAQDPAPRPEVGAAPAAVAPEPVATEPAPEGAVAPQGESPLPVPPVGEAVAPDLARPVDEGRLALTEEPPSAEQGQPVDPFGQNPQDGAQIIVIDAPSAPAGTAATPLENAPGTVVGRLPSIQADDERVAMAAPETTPDLPEAGFTPSALPAPNGPRPIEAFAAPFSAQEGQSYYAIILIDTGTKAGGLDQATIKTLNLPITIAIDPTRPNAAEDAAAYRAAGYEIAILASPLPQGATGQDVEITLEAWRQVLPEAVAVVEAPAPVFQSNRALSQAMTKALAREGLGLVTQNGGLNAAEQLAKSGNIPSARVWRVLDTGREKAPMIDRMLDRAAFEAEKSGAVVVMLSTWPESVAGLLHWQPEAGVMLAPFSALALRPAPAPL